KIPGRFGFDPLLDIQVLSPMHRGILGVSSLNRHLQFLLNPGSGGIVIGSQQLRIGDKVMQMRNNYDLGVFNGDMGKITNIDHEGSQIEVDIDEHIVCYQLADLDNLALAYACSIHKAQGNEYPAVVIVLHTQHYIMLHRNLLYTALTRGKSLVVVVGSMRALGLAVKREDSTQRYTLLKNRLIE
ncbi:MAG: ATP-binding domain-containing protein, partial [Deltaproteobacteria bacterium]|nr:ATP-binding domain-containing protein [Deltaproteobacteria bacterium]